MIGSIQSNGLPLGSVLSPSPSVLPLCLCTVFVSALSLRALCSDVHLASERICAHVAPVHLVRLCSQLAYVRYGALDITPSLQMVLQNGELWQPDSWAQEVVDALEDTFFVGVGTLCSLLIGFVSVLADGSRVLSMASRHLRQPARPALERARVLGTHAMVQPSGSRRRGATAETALAGRFAWYGGLCCVPPVQATVFFNTTAIHSLPIGLNLLRNAAFRAMTNDTTRTIVTHSHPLPLTTSQKKQLGIMVRFKCVQMCVPSVVVDAH